MKKIIVLSLIFIQVKVITLVNADVYDWQIQTVDSQGDVGEYTSIALDSLGNPHISYYGNGNLKYAKWTGYSWQIQTVDSQGDVGEYTSIALDSLGNPHISYYGNGNLKYAKWTGSSWQIQTVDSQGLVGESTSIALDSLGNPHISYYGNGNLKYAKWTGYSWQIQTVDSECGVGWFTSIALDSLGNPHISYYDHTNKDLKYAKWTGYSWQIQTVDSKGDVGWFTSIALDALGNPHISYCYYCRWWWYENLKYAKWSGSSWQIQTVDSQGLVGENTSIALDALGNPHISYYDVTNKDLKYAKWTGYSWQIQTVDSQGLVGENTSIALDALGNPHISYYDVTNKDLKYAAPPRFGYTSISDTELKSSTGKILTKLPVATKIEIEKREKEFLFVKVNETLKGWVKKENICYEKPDIMKPVVRIIEKSFSEPELYLKGVAYDDIKVASVKFGNKALKKASFQVEKGNYEDAYPFEGKITLVPGIEMVLKAEDASGKITNIPINIETSIVDYTPKYVQIEVKKQAPVREKPDTNSNIITTVSEKTILVAIGNKDGWYYLEGGGWIHNSVINEKEPMDSVSPSVVVAVEAPKTPKIITQPVDIDVDIPVGKTNPDAIGVIICVKDYEHRDVPAVEYALNDGETMKNYFTKLFGIKEENIIFLKNAKKSDFERLFGTEKDYKGQVYNWVKPNVSDVYVYYAGHGVPDIDVKEAYFLPSDAHPNYVKLNGYSMDILYRNLSKVPSKSTTLIIEACFSGQSEKGMLINRASGIAIVPKEEFKGTRFSASSGEQVASWYPEKKHSLFTYFFLKGLKGEADENKDKIITIEEINKYVVEKVKYQARRMYNREQEPEFRGDLNKPFVNYR